MCRKNKSASPRAGKALFSEMVAARDSSVRRTIRAPGDNNCSRTVPFRSQAINGPTPPSAVVIGADLSGFRRLSNPFRHTAPGRAASRRRLNAASKSLRKSSGEGDRPRVVRTGSRPSSPAFAHGASHCCFTKPFGRATAFRGSSSTEAVSFLRFWPLAVFASSGGAPGRARPQPAAARPLPI
jgi:hypothetical protein